MVARRPTLNRQGEICRLLRERGNERKRRAKSVDTMPPSLFSYGEKVQSKLDSCITGHVEYVDLYGRLKLFERKEMYLSGYFVKV